MKKLAIVLLIVGCIIPVTTYVQHIFFQQNCGGYLKQAADANSVELSLERLNLALDYIENKNLTRGYTSILWKTEDDNIEFWYNNLKTCQKELENALDATQLEKTNVLMKVRESLTDDKGENGIQITVPNGISRYPNNVGYAFGNTLCGIMLLIGLFLLV